MIFSFVAMETALLERIYYLLYSWTYLYTTRARIVEGHSFICATIVRSVLRILCDVETNEFQGTNFHIDPWPRTIADYSST